MRPGHDDDGKYQFDHIELTLAERRLRIPQGDDRDTQSDQLEEELQCLLYLFSAQAVQTFDEEHGTLFDGAVFDRLDESAQSSFRLVRPLESRDAEVSVSGLVQTVAGVSARPSPC